MRARSIVSNSKVNLYSDCFQMEPKTLKVILKYHKHASKPVSTNQIVALASTPNDKNESSEN